MLTAWWQQGGSRVLPSKTEARTKDAEDLSGQLPLRCRALRGGYRPFGRDRPLQLLDLQQDTQLGRADQAGGLSPARRRGRAERLSVRHEERPSPVLPALRRAVVQPR